MNLYELSARYQQLFDKEDYTPEELKELDSLFSSIEYACIQRGKYIRNLEAEAEIVDKAIVDMKKRSRDLWDKADRQRDKLALAMRANNIDQIKTSPLFALSVRDNPLSVDVVDSTAIPESFYRVKVTETKSLDKTLIKQTIDKGEEVPGARLIRKLKIEFK